MPTAQKVRCLKGGKGTKRCKNIFLCFSHCTQLCSQQTNGIKISCQAAKMFFPRHQTCFAWSDNLMFTSKSIEQQHMQA